MGETDINHKVPPYVHNPREGKEHSTTTQTAREGFPEKVTPELRTEM